MRNQTLNMIMDMLENVSRQYNEGSISLDQHVTAMRSLDDIASIYGWELKTRSLMGTITHILIGDVRGCLSQRSLVENDELLFLDLCE